MYQLGAERHAVFYSIPSIPTEMNMFCACLRLVVVNKHPPWSNVVQLIYLLVQSDDIG